ncbi:Macrophage mannose receptor 1 [Aphelenchoides avenae]|nr:Macrophage mannose receptor 1 [Aphelenchus avenae]
MICRIVAQVAVIVAVSFSVVSAKCGPNAFNGLNNSTCYVPGSQFANDWLFASFDCQAKGGNLPSVPNAFVNAHLSSLMRNFTHYQDFKDMWLGGSTNVWPPSFLWTDGSPFDYTNWGSGK